MASIDTQLLLDIVHHDKSEISPRIADVYCKMVEDLKVLKAAIENKSNPSPEIMSILNNVRGKYYEIYKRRIPLGHLPETILYNNEVYDIKEITKEYLNDILKLEQELEQKD
ncbi:MAG: hypothetical protein HRU41_40015 [Saprospiraceae bacterium]|nr:hypothetical protein [Saprospiraceae bacterium]